ncbi:signal peptidase [Ralstonia pseudosolanacearum]|uniref:signal peptidase n=1 Tax=Ralstonia pseudosolanacearum TaxID=1310165 RepID=UPI001FFBA1D8|nr:signal peptidase [Ralstonia pseudosolanacearum]
MPMFHTARRWFFLALFAAPPAAWAAGDMSSSPPFQALTSEQPIVVCRQFPAEQIARLKAGDKQLVFVVEHYQPPRNASAGLYVTAPNHTGRSAATARIGIYPDQPSAVQQRFLLHPSEYAGAVQADRICLSVGFYRETELPRGGKASVGLDLADTPR